MVPELRKNVINNIFNTVLHFREIQNYNNEPLKGHEAIVQR